MESNFYLFIFQDNADLLLLVRLMALGLNAWDMIDCQVFKEPKLVSFYSDFLLYSIFFIQQLLLFFVFFNLLVDIFSS